MATINMSNILEYDEARRQQIENALEGIVEQMVMDCANNADSIIFATEHKLRMKNKWLRKISEAMI